MRTRTRLAAGAVAVATCAALATQLPSASHDGARAKALQPAPPPAKAIAPRLLGRPVPTPPWTPYATRPNILMITADDLASGDLAYMPHVRALMERQGVTFTDALAPTPICVPARASLDTGQYAHNHGAVTIEGENGGYASFDDKDTVPVALQRAGYDTLFAGKYLNGYGEDGTAPIPPGWTDWRATLDPSTYDFFHPVINDNGVLESPPGYTTDTMSAMADEMLSDPQREQRPWYLWLNYVAPHHGSPVEADDPGALWPGTDAGKIPTTVPAPEDRGTFRNVPIPDTPDLFRIPDNAPPASVSRGYVWHKRGKEALRIQYDQRLEAVQDLDRAVASQIEVLRRTHQLDNTIVIVGSDNGFATGEHNVEGKLWHYDDIIRVPMMMRGPGIPRGRDVGTTVTNPDIAATILAAAGAPSLRPLDGVSILPWLHSPARERVVPIEGWRVENGGRRLYAGVRVGPWTYIRYRHGDEEMYNRAEDPYEIRSLAGLPDYRRQLRQLRRLTAAYENCAGATCPKTFYTESDADSPKNTDVDPD